jgi:hypothetical protein
MPFQWLIEPTVCCGSPASTTNGLVDDECVDVTNGEQQVSFEYFTSLPKLQFVADLRPVLRFGAALVDDECMEVTTYQQQVSFEHMHAVSCAHH